jgi:hypothetical protein
MAKRLKEARYLIFSPTLIFSHHDRH